MNEEEQRRAALEAVAGCERLIAQIDESRVRLAPLVPISAGELDSLGVEQWDTLYAFQMKFLLLQDLANRRLLRGFLALAGEDPRNFTFREAVDRVAELGAIADGGEWLALTAVRNMLVHDYPVDLAQFALRLDDAWIRCDQLINNVRLLIDGLKRNGLL